MTEPIAVVGGGHAGHCMAADLALAGHQVIFCAHPGAHPAFDQTRRLGRIELEGYGRVGVAHPTFTVDPAEALGPARLVHVCLPAMRHLELFEALAPHLRPDHEVVFWSGNFAALRFAHWLRERGLALPLLGEASTVPYSTRLSGPGRVHVQALAAWVLLSAVPATGTPELLERCAPLWPGVVRPADHVLQAAFSNPNTVVHAPPVILNLGRIEYSGGEFFVYKEGITPAVTRVIRALYAELERVATAYGFRPWRYAEADFAPPASVVTAVFAGPQAEGELARSKGPGGPHHRYLTEDLPYGLAPIGRLARLAGVATPLLDGLLALGSVAAEQDFWSSGPGLGDLGLAGLDVHGVADFVRHGPRPGG